MYRVLANTRTFLASKEEAPWPITLAACVLTVFTIGYVAAAILGSAS